MRRQSREMVFKYIFSKLFNCENEGLFDVLSFELNDNDKAFAKDLLAVVEKDKDKNLKIIEEYLIGFKLDRISKVDKCALLIGMAELDNFIETPTAVVIDEAVSLCAKYSTEKSTDFVNGVLARYLQNK